MIEARGLVLRFGNRTVLDGVDITLRPGEIVGLIGPPESGKSVLFKLLAGLIDPQSGSIGIDGETFAGKGEAQRYILRRSIGMVFQNNALFDFLNIADNVGFSLREAPDPARVAASLHDVGLGRAGQLFPHELSGGMKKRAGIARATVTRPRYCFYDEPTAGLDPVTAAKIYRLIGTFAERDNAGALVISNELGTLLPACNRVLMLHAGRIIYSGPASGLAHAEHAVVRQFATGAVEGPL